MTVTVNNSAFVFAHGRSPRGQGSWAFGRERNTRVEECVWFNGTFAEARKQAVAWARANGVDQVWTQS